MNHKKTESFFVVETVSGDGQYLCEFLSEYTTRDTTIEGTSRNIYDKRIHRFESYQSAYEICEGVKNDPFSDNPRVLKVKVELSIEEA